MIEECSDFTIEGDQLTIYCKLGLWSVTGPMTEGQNIIDEAWRYFLQYKNDGEYDDLLGIDRSAMTDKYKDVDLKMYGFSQPDWLFIRYNKR